MQPSPFDYQRRPTISVDIAGVPLGSNYPVRVQSMTTTDTNDVEQSVAQSQRIADAGADYVRLTAQGVREAESIGLVREQLRAAGYTVPLIADIHFTKHAAYKAATTCDKVRINPGNFVDPARQFKDVVYDDQQYHAELQRIRKALLPFIELCKQHHTAVRLGVNHGSLSDRIMTRYGNTAPGMVESVMEYLRVFIEQEFYNVVISMKASNVVVMVEAVRRLVAAMDAEGMHFPLHLGVTEAGFGEDGRIKSSVGIGALMAQGLGDTIRVSLSEDPEYEVPVTQKLVQYIAARTGHEHIPGELAPKFDPLNPQRRKSIAVRGILGDKLAPIVIASCQPTYGQAMADFYYSPTGAIDRGNRYIVPADVYSGKENEYPLFTLEQFDPTCSATMKFIAVDATVDIATLEPLRGRTDTVLILSTTHVNIPGSEQAFMHRLMSAGIDLPVVVRNTYADADAEWLQVKAGADFGALLLNGFSDGIWLEAPNFPQQGQVVSFALGILQAARLRTTVTEFISCPSCGRTLFNLQDTVKLVKAATAHLTHLKIGVMGCIVNGPGEMADADYGYVGAAPGRISLYKGKECVKKNLPQADAIPQLVELIKENGDWRDPD